MAMAMVDSSNLFSKTSILNWNSITYTQLNANASTSILVKLHTIILLLIRQNVGAISITNSARFYLAHSILVKTKQKDMIQLRIGIAPGRPSLQNLFAPSALYVQTKLLMT